MRRKGAILLYLEDTKIILFFLPLLVAQPTTNTNKKAHQNI